MPDTPQPNATAPAPADTGMTIRGEGFRIPLDGQWKFQVEETWEGGRRPEISASVPIAQQFLMNSSPVADLLRPSVLAAAAASAPARGTGAGANTGPRGRSRRTWRPAAADHRRASPSSPARTAIART